MRRVSLLMSLTENDPEGQRRVIASGPAVAASKHAAAD